MALNFTVMSEVRKEHYGNEADLKQVNCGADEDWGRIFATARTYFQQNLLHLYKTNMEAS
jgi:hypothetical protein